jgi:hypothetical protein
MCRYFISLEPKHDPVWLRAWNDKNGPRKMRLKLHLKKSWMFFGGLKVEKNYDDFLFDNLFVIILDLYLDLPDNLVLG